MTIKAHYDGKVIVPDQSVDLLVNQPLLVTVEQGVVFVDPPDGKPATVGDLVSSSLNAPWKDRTDIGS